MKPLVWTIGLLISVFLEWLLLQLIANGIGTSVNTLLLSIGCVLLSLGVLSSLNLRSLKYNAAVILVLILAALTGTAR